MKKRSIFVLAIVLVFGFIFSGCSRDTRTIFYYALSSKPATLDPQLARDDTAFLIVENCFEGLMRDNGDGTVSLGVAESYSVSEDGLTYTFKLRKDCFWTKIDEPVTAYDFVFAFRRLLSKTTQAPFAEDYLCIKGAAQLLSGEEPSVFGVSAPNDYTLVFTLEEPSPDFLFSLTKAAAMPCNEEFFTEQKGKYGHVYYNLIYNGPFYISSYRENEYWKIRRNSGYSSSALALPYGVNMYYLPNNTPLQNLTDGYSDIAKISPEELPLLENKGFVLGEITNKTWVVALNSRDPLFANDDMRRAVAYAINYPDLADSFPSDFSAANGLIPPASNISGTPYRSLAGDSAYLGYDPDAAKDYLASAKETLSEDALSSIQLYCPDDTLDFVAGKIQKNLQETLSIQVNVVRISPSQLSSATQSGNYQLALIPLEPDFDSPSAVLSPFAAEDNFIGFYSPEFISFYNAAISSSDPSSAASHYKKAEQLLIENNHLLPIAYQTSYFALGKDISGLFFPSFSEKLFFKFTAIN